MRRTHYLVIILLLIAQTSFGQIYQNMAQPGYKFSRARFDSVLTIPSGLGNLKNITGGQDTGQIRFNKSDSSVYVWNGRAWIKPVGGGVSDTLKVSVSDTAAMLAPYARAANFIPLSGTLVGKPITGDLQFDNLGGDKRIKGNTSSSYIELTDDGGININKDSGSNVNVMGIVFNGQNNSGSDGITGVKNYSANYNSLSFIQKVYSDSITNLKLNISDTATMLAPYSRVTVSSYGKNAGGDSTILVLSNGTRYAAKDSVGGGGASGWGLTGNAGINAATNFLGTTDNQSLRIRTNNIERILIDSIGNTNFSSAKIFGYPNSLATSSINPTASGLDSGTISLYRGSYKIGIDASASVYLQSGNPLSTDLFVFYKGATKQFSKIDNNGNFSVASGGRYVLDAGTSPANPTANPQAGTYSLFDATSNTWKIGMAGVRSSKFDMYFSTGATAGGGYRWYQGTTELASISQAGNLLLGGNTTDNASALLNVTSTTKGVLFPRMTLTQRNAIASPAAGLQVIVTGETGGEFVSMYNSSLAAWVNATSKWSTNANGINYNGGNVGIGTATPANALVITRSTNATDGIFVNNTSSGNSARSLIRLTNNLSEVAQLSIWGSGTGLANKTFFEATKDFVIGTDAGVASGGTSKFQIYTGGFNNATTPQVTVDGVGSMGIGTTTPNSWALLDLTSTTKGILIPRMTTAQRNAISLPTAGLQIYNTNQQRVNFFDGSMWRYSPTAFTDVAAPTTTPLVVGDTFTDSTNKKMYVSTGTASSADWTILN